MSRDNAHAAWEPSRFNNRWVFRLAHWVCGTLPRPALYALSDSVMEWFQGYQPSTAAAIEDNLSKAFPKKERAEILSLASQTFVTYGRGVVDYLTAQTTPPEITPRDGTWETLSSLKGGAILVTAHIGNWEVGGIFLGERVGPHTMVGFPERDAGVDAFRRQKRDALGHTTLSVGMGVSGMLGLRRLLEEGGRMVVLADRPVGKDAVGVTFLGRRANFLKSPAVFSLLTRVPLIPVAIMCDGPGKYSAFVGEPFTARDCGDDAGRAMQRTADFFSDLLERYPDQWYNFYRYWREAP